MNNTRIAELQLNALREALDRAGKTAVLAEGRARRALGDLQIERGRSARIEQQLNEAVARLESAKDENRRLRDLIGDPCKLPVRSSVAPEPFSRRVREESIPDRSRAAA